MFPLSFFPQCLRHWTLLVHCLHSRHLSACCVRLSAPPGTQQKGKQRHLAQVPVLGGNSSPCSVLPQVGPVVSAFPGAKPQHGVCTCTHLGEIPGHRCHSCNPNPLVWLHVLLVTGTEGLAAQGLRCNRDGGKARPSSGVRASTGPLLWEATECDPQAAALHVLGTSRGHRKRCVFLPGCPRPAELSAGQR